MAQPTPMAAEAEPAKKKRVAATVRFPIYSVADGVGVSQAIHDKGGGVASNDQLAAYLGYSSARNGAYFDRVSSARLFGLIQGQGSSITLTPRAQEILMPVFPDQARKALIDAFFAVPLYKALYDEFYGKQLAPEFGMKNLLRTRYGVPPSRLEKAWRAFNESADQAGFYATRGNRTQLIIPRLGGAATMERTVTDNAFGGDSSVKTEAPDLGGGDGPRDGEGPGTGGQRPRQAQGSAPRSTEELKGLYVSALIDMLRAKNEPDPDLMRKIEELLGLAESGK
jgi:hypothetical protein